jgi:ADP-dependent NAD(P)H-hydrate dehydratase / NAD(P)H-hydrate epimerase
LLRFGTGFSGKIIEAQSSAIDLINSSKTYVVSNDVPSGISADTGEIKEKSVSPVITVVLHRIKSGIKGNHMVESIGIPPDAEKQDQLPLGAVLRVQQKNGFFDIDHIYS